MPGGRGTDITQLDFSGDLVRHRPDLERAARRLCRNRHDAEDLVQSALVRAWQARAQFVSGGNLAGWLFRILTNQFRDNLRRRHGVQVPMPDDIPDPTPADDDVSSLLATPSEVVLDALGQLSPELRAPLELKALHGKRYHEIAKELGIPVNTVGTRIRRARHKLQQLLAKLVGRSGDGS